MTEAVDQAHEEETSLRRKGSTAYRSEESVDDLCSGDHSNIKIHRILSFLWIPVLVVFLILLAPLILIFPDHELMMGLIASSIGFFATIGVFYPLLRGSCDLRKAIGFFKPSIRSILLGLGVTFVFMTIQMIALATFFPGQVPSNTNEMVAAVSGPEKIAILLLVSLLAPLSEEIFYRGFLLHVMGRGFNAATGVLFSSLMFSLSHFQGASSPRDFFVLGTTFVFGICLSIVRLRTGNIWSSFAGHSANNSAISIGMLMA